MVTHCRQDVSELFLVVPDIAGLFGNLRDQEHGPIAIRIAQGREIERKLIAQDRDECGHSTPLILGNGL